MIHQGGHLYDLASQHSAGEKDKWQVADVYRLHKP